MAENRAAWGIDIGQSALKAIKVRYIDSAKQFVAEAFDYIQFPKILSQPDAVPGEIVPEAMRTFLGRNELRGDLVAISVPGQSALARFIQLPPVEAKKLPEIVKYEARQQIPFALEEVIWDYQPLGGGSEESGFLIDAEVGLFAMKRDQVMQQLQPYTNAKIEVELVQIAPLALYSVLGVDELGIRRDSAADPGDEFFIVLDMGCDNTTLMVSNGFKIWIRNVPIGGNHFTRALTKEMKLSFAKAEHLKCNATKSPDPRAVFQALRPVFNDYVSEIQRSIGYFSSVNRQAKIAKVIGMGNAFKLAGLQKFLQQNLQYEVDRPDRFKALSGDAVVNSPLFAENLLSFGVPYGLALQALSQTKIRTSLLPPEIIRARLVRKKKPWAVAAAAVALGAFTVSTAVNAFQNGAVNTPAWAAAKTKAEEFGTTVTGLTGNYTAEERKHAAAYTKLHSLVDGRRSVGTWIDIYNAVNDCLPFDANEEVEIDISLRHQISLTEFSSQKTADVASWYAKLREDQKEYLADVDKTTGPSGEGYIFTLRGQHWHHDPKQQLEQGVVYLKHFFLKNLQAPTVQREGYPLRKVRDMGITYATIMDCPPARKVFLPIPGVINNKEISRLSGPTGAAAGMQGMAGVAGMPAGGGMMAGGGGIQSIFAGAKAAAPGAAGAYGGAGYGAGYEGGTAGAGAYGGAYGADGGFGAGAYGAAGMPGDMAGMPGMAGVPGMPGIPGMNSADIPTVMQTDFVIQFIYLTPGSAAPADGTEAAPADGTEAAPADGAAAAATI